MDFHRSSRRSGQILLQILALAQFTMIGSQGFAKEKSVAKPVENSEQKADSSVIQWDKIPLKSIGGREFNTSQLTNKVVLVVNTASKCGYTPQFKELQGLYQKYQDKGLMVLGFPSDDFNQDPGSEQEIAKFCEVNYGVKFPLMAKGSVKGDGAQKLFRQLTELSPDKGNVQWNFEKFLVDRSGKVTARFRSGESTDKIEPAVAKLLEKGAS